MNYYFKKILLLLVSGFCFGRLGAQCVPPQNQLANPQMTEANPNLTMTVGVPSTIQFRFASAGDDPIPASTIFIQTTISTDDNFEFVPPYLDPSTTYGTWTVDPSRTTTDAVTIINTGAAIPDGVAQDIKLIIKPKVVNVVQVYTVSVERIASMTSCVGNTIPTGDNDSKWAEVKAITVVPISLREFTATKQQATSLLKWSTSQESNSAYTEIDRSGDGLQYSAIGKVKAAGESDRTTYYSFTDNAPLSGTNYYRLKFVDKDGSFKWSNIEVVKFDNADNATGIYPNPAQGQLTLTIPEKWKGKAMTALLYDGTGRLALHKEIKSASSTEQIKWDNVLPAGVYMLKLLKSDNTTEQFKIQILR